jgi:hypothetical protein
VTLHFSFQAGKGILTLDGLPVAAVQFVIAVVEHVPRLDQFVELCGECILQKIIGSASALRGEIVELLLNLGSKM